MYAVYLIGTVLLLLLLLQKYMFERNFLGRRICNCFLSTPHICSANALVLFSCNFKYNKNAQNKGTANTETNYCEAVIRQSAGLSENTPHCLELLQSKELCTDSLGGVQ